MDDVWDASMEAALRAAEASAVAHRAAAPRAGASGPPPPPAALATCVFASEGPARQPPRLAPVFAAAAGGAAGPSRPPPPPHHHRSNGPHPTYCRGGGGPLHGVAAGYGQPPPINHSTWPPPSGPPQHPFRPTAVCVAPPPPGPSTTATLHIGPDATIDVALSGDIAAARSALASVGAAWVPDARAWRVPLARLPDAQSALVGLGRIAVDPAPDVALRILRSAAAVPDDTDRYSAIPPRLEAALMPFQRDGVKFALSRGGRTLIGDEMGLGKTVQALAVAAAYRSEWPALIIAPSSLREAWADALAEWLGVRGSRVLVINAAKDGDGVGIGPAPPHDFVIASYNLVPKLRARLETAAFRVVILDESHYIKDGKVRESGVG